MASLMHIIGTTWDGSTPALTCAIAGELETRVVAGRFKWHVGERTCTGYWADGWHPCPDREPTGHDWQCVQCFRGRGDPARRDDQPQCIFEPICQGAPERCVCSFGGVKRPEPHVVYCAFYGGLPKVGMTTTRRVHTRLVEQGADAYFIIQERPDRQEARRTEVTVSKLYGLPEWRRHAEVFPQLTRPVDEARIEAVAQQWRADLAARFEVQGLHHIHHALGPLPALPQRVQVEGDHAGTWLGAKGGHLFYQPPAGVFGAPVLALKRGDLIGRWVTAADGAPT